jgi:mannose/cellobiose epimerase-like protein (N-acyl-D-glucosamine 2-epimerase family)
VETPGLWRDKQGPDGAFVEEPASASSLYHIIAAVSELQRTY